MRAYYSISSGVWRFVRLCRGLDRRLNHQPPAAGLLDNHYTKNEPASSSCDRAEDIGQIMCSKGYPAKPDQGYGQKSAEYGQDSPSPTFPDQNGEDGQQAIEQGSSHGMAAGKTVATQIKKFAVTKRAVPVNNYLDKVVDQHSAGHRQDDSKQSVPTLSQYQNQNRDRRDCSNPEGRPSVAQSEHQIDERSCQMPMKPSGDLMVDNRNSIDS